MRTTGPTARLIIALTALLWAGSGLWSTALATDELLAHLGEDHHEIHHGDRADDGEAYQSPTPKTGEEHEHPSDVLCGPCHVHALKTDDGVVPLIAAAWLRTFVGSEDHVLSRSPGGLFRPPRV